LLDPKVKRQLKAASLGIDKVLLCPHCMVENEVYSAAGHKQNEINLHCVECGGFVTRLKRNYTGQYELDGAAYG